MAFDYEEMRRIYRLEKATSRLVDVPDDFLFQVHSLIDVERKNYLDSLADLNTAKARDFSNLKKLVEELFSIREKKLLNTVLVSTRLQEADDAHMAREEKELFHLLFNSLSSHRVLTQKVLDANGEFISAQTVSVIPKIKIEEKKENNVKEEPREVLVATAASRAHVAQTNATPNSSTIASPAAPTATPHVHASNSAAAPAANASTSMQRVRILSEIPSFVGTDMKEYGPFKPEEVVELPQKIAQLFVSRKLGESA